MAVNEQTQKPTNMLGGKAPHIRRGLGGALEKVLEGMTDAQIKAISSSMHRALIHAVEEHDYSALSVGVTGFKTKPKYPSHVRVVNGIPLLPHVFHKNEV